MLAVVAWMLPSAWTFTVTDSIWQALPPVHGA